MHPLQRHCCAVERTINGVFARPCWGASPCQGWTLTNSMGYAPCNHSGPKHCRFRAAVEHNHASAQYGLGYMHLVGHGVAMNHRKAYKYFSSAAEQVGLSEP